jgi:hypothetical protein
MLVRRWNPQRSPALANSSGDRARPTPEVDRQSHHCIPQAGAMNRAVIAADLAAHVTHR